MEQAMVKELQAIADTIKFNREMDCQEIAQELYKDFFANVRFVEKVTGKKVAVAHWKVTLQ